MSNKIKKHILVKIYCISGLGADFTAFRNLKINAEMVPVEWLPVEKHENFEHYCSRLIGQIGRGHQINLMGVSFGGTVAQTISQLIPVNKTILISTIQKHSELPLLYRMFAQSSIPKSIPKRVFHTYHPIISWSFGIKSKKEKELLKKVIKKTDAHFAKWALNQFLQWDGNLSGNNSCLRLHGTADRLLPMPGNAPNIVPIENGTHLMVLNKAREISKAINEFLELP